LIICRLGAKSIEQEEEDDDGDGDIYPEIDLLLFELDNVIDDDLKSIPDDLIYKCQLALSIWSIDGREDNDYPPSTSEHHANANRLMEKIRQTYIALGGNELDREGFVRDVFRLEQQWIVSAVQYYSFIKYYDDPMNPSHIFKLIQWTIYPIDFMGGFAPMYHLERSYSDEFGYTYVLGRKIHPHYHESLIDFGDYCPSYMELKLLIIGDIIGEAPLDALIASGYLE
jgi:hypothetical protein